MPRKTATQKAAEKLESDKNVHQVERPPLWSHEDDQWLGFLNVRLDEDEHEAFNVWWGASADHIGEMTEDVIAEGAKLSVAYDSENESWVTTLTGRLCRGLNGRCAASARAGTMNEALALLMYKHYMMARKDWGSYLPKTSNFKKWG